MLLFSLSIQLSNSHIKRRELIAACLPASPRDQLFGGNLTFGMEFSRFHNRSSYRRRCPSLTGYHRPARQTLASTDTFP